PPPGWSALPAVSAGRRCQTCGKTFRYRSNLLEH
uniref:C2H2-type domain-containing protein n=1 Tax=Pelusios castaneus TaxID=367368 RepID=A0A8C8VIY0_9SAUR